MFILSRGDTELQAPLHTLCALGISEYVGKLDTLEQYQGRKVHTVFEIVYILLSFLDRTRVVVARSTSLLRKSLTS